MEITLSGELLSKLSGKKIDDLKALLQTEEGETKEDAAKIFCDTVVTKFRDAEKAAKEQQYNRGIREKGEAIEKSLKPLFKKYSVESSTAEEGIEQLAEKLKEGPSMGDPADLDKEKLRKLPAFQELLNEELQVKDKAIQNLQKEYEDFKSDIHTKTLSEAVKKSALKVLEKSNARFSGDGVDEKMEDINFYLKAIGVSNFKQTDDGELIPVDGDGNQLRDDAKNLVSFDDYIKKNWRFGFDNVPKDRNPSSAQKTSGGSESSYKFTSKEDFERMMDQAGNDRKKRIEIQQAYAKHIEAQENK